MKKSERIELANAIRAAGEYVENLGFKQARIDALAHNGCCVLGALYLHNCAPIANSFDELSRIAISHRRDSGWHNFNTTDMIVNRLQAKFPYLRNRTTKRRVEIKSCLVTLNDQKQLSFIQIADKVEAGL